MKYLEVLRQRKHLSAANPEKDAEILTMSPEDMFREVMAWYLGDSGWARQVSQYIVDLGADPYKIVKG